MLSDSDSIEDEGIFYFESDHLALRGNPDYTNVLRSVAMLEAQRVLVHKQLEELELAKQIYLKHPEIFLEKLRNNEEIISPNYINIVKIPEVKTYALQNPALVQIKTEPTDHAFTNDPQTVRGRVCEGIKSETFNRLWSNEEQRRLEELLIEFPPEDVEMRRFAKIAKALGSRTPQQVSSRVQKYFQKLYEAGLPVPGRQPKYRKPGVPKQRHLLRPSTFFPAQNVSVRMPEDDLMLSNGSSVVEETAPPIIKIEPMDATDESQRSNGTQLKMILILRKIRDEKLRTSEGYNPDPLAAKCEDCDSAPISRTHWRCHSCYCYINLCNDCFVEQLISNTFEHIAHDVVSEQET